MPRAIRHVAASLYLRKNRQDWDGLASLLRDDYQTVRKTYAHLSEVEETTNLEQKMELQLEAINSANKA